MRLALKIPMMLLNLRSARNKLFRSVAESSLWLKVSKLAQTVRKMAKATMALPRLRPPLAACAAKARE